jgi:RNA polymerase sigma-70 factor (ECF subfamily)
MTPSESGSPGGFFEATLWSTIIKAKDGDESTRSAAMDRMLARYRQPILRHIQDCQRCEPEQAEDLCQGFLTQCLRLDFLKRVAPEHGRFRTFIKTCIGNFLRDEHVRASAQKRGGGQTPESLDATDEDGHRLVDPADVPTDPGLVLDREWALQVLDRAMERLRRESATSLRASTVEALEGHLGRAPDAGTAEAIGARLGAKVGTVHVAMSRTRGRLGELIREEIRQTVGTEEDLREELSYLIELLGR